MSNGSYINTSILDGLPTTDDETRWAAVLRETEDLRMQLEDIRQQLAPRETSINESYDVDVGYPTDDQMLTWDASTSTWGPGSAVSVPGGVVAQYETDYTDCVDATFTVDLNTVAQIYQCMTFYKVVPDGGYNWILRGKANIVWSFGIYDGPGSYKVLAVSGSIAYVTYHWIDQPMIGTSTSGYLGNYAILDTQDSFEFVDQFSVGYVQSVSGDMYAKINGTSLTIRVDTTSANTTTGTASYLFVQPNAT